MRWHLFFVFFFLLVMALVMALSGCGTSGSRDDAAPPLSQADGGAVDAAGVRADDGSAGAFQPAAHPALERVPNHGGRVLAHVELVTVTFAGYAYESSIHAFGDWVVGSDWLTSGGAEYGVGAGRHVAHVVVPDAAPASVELADIQTFLTNGIGSGLLPSPAAAADDDYVYLIFYPASTKVNAPGFQGCETGGFHASFDAGAAHRIAYAPIPDCSAENQQGWSPVASIEENAAHELIEAITDPDWDHPAWVETDPANPWSAFYGEVADFCVGGITVESGFTASRFWSNAAAAAGRDPCQPTAADAVFYDVSPTTAGPVGVTPGGRVSFDVAAWSTAPRAPWSVVAAKGWISDFDPAPKLDRGRVSNGDVARVTVSAPPSARPGQRASVFLYSYEEATGPWAIWPVDLVVCDPSGCG